MSIADAAFDALSVIHPAFAFGVFVLSAAALSTSCELVAAALGDLLDASLRRVWGVISISSN